MRVKVWARRTKGRIQPWNRQSAPIEGMFRTSVQEAPDYRKVIVLSVEGKDGVFQLFEPRLISAGGIELKFTGYERDDYHWVIQEWVCELQDVIQESDAAIRVKHGLPAVPLPR
ncbi:hypothetical protein [Variovorax sp. V15]|uniref:hypothetical protein n=1 Tax=Variovorax sp. V15 TaxID=3065952 RepID=UPI0034E87950